MKALRITNRCQKDIKLLERRGRDLKRLKFITDKLRSGLPLSPIDDDHPLKGEWQPARCCHIQGDWCLIYENNPAELVLIRTGSHSDLFGR